LPLKPVVFKTSYGYKWITETFTTNKSLRIELYTRRIIIIIYLTFIYKMNNSSVD